MRYGWAGVSSVAGKFGRDNVKHISSMLGIEPAKHFLKICGMNISEHTIPLHIDYPLEHWRGWILAYYQWYS